MKFLKEWEYLEHIRLCGGPTKIIAPYPLHKFVLKHLINIADGLPVKIITQSKQPLLEGHGFEIRTWKNMHAKLYIGTNGAMWGSWNFNMNHPKKTTLREIVEYCTKEEEKYKGLHGQFNVMWERAKWWNK